MYNLILTGTGVNYLHTHIAHESVDDIPNVLATFEIPESLTEKVSHIETSKLAGHFYLNWKDTDLGYDALQIDHFYPFDKATELQHIGLGGFVAESLFGFIYDQGENEETSHSTSSDTYMTTKNERLQTIIKKRGFEFEDDDCLDNTYVASISDFKQYSQK